MKTQIALLFAFAFLIGLYSCECGGWKCNKANYMYEVNFKGFSDSDLTPLVINRYVKNTNLDSFYRTDTIYDLESGYTDVEKTRTLHLNETAYDYAFVAPRLNATYTLTQIGFTTGTCTNCNKKYKIQELNSYVLNGTYKTGQDVVIQK